MSADSLNASPLKLKQDVQSPIDDKTYTKDDEEKESKCERLSQVSPFLLSPTTDSSVPDSEPAGMSTLSKITIPTDAKSSKPSETQCLSKATSIDSWCSNDTLYNVEENFDDLAMDADALDFRPEPEHDQSESEDTLTHNDDDKEHSHCSTYIVHDTKSEAGDSFSPDSITANDNYTYTKVKTEEATVTKSDLDYTKNTQTKDLAYGTLLSGLPSYSNCTTDLVSGIDETWKLPQPELVRRSPISDRVDFTPPRRDKRGGAVDSPQFKSEPCLKKMDSVEITCLTDNVIELKFDSPECQAPNEVVSNDSPDMHFRNMGSSVTSTPLIVTTRDDENISIEINPQQNNSQDSSSIANNVPNFQTFFRSAEKRPHDISSNTNNDNVSSEILLAGESKTLSRDSYKDVLESTPTESDFEVSGVSRSGPVNSRDKSSLSGESGMTSEEFRQFESSVKNCPQDLSSMIDASSLLLLSERRCSELALTNLTNIGSDCTNRSETQVVNSEPESLSPSSSNCTNLMESHTSNNMPINVFITDIDLEDENEQPHSIIVTESPLVAANITQNMTFDSHSKVNQTEPTFDSHSKNFQATKSIWGNENTISEQVNGTMDALVTDPEVKPARLSISNSSLPSMQSLDKSTENNTNQSKETKITNGGDNVENIETKKDEEKFNACNGTNEVYATINTISETFEELVESNVDDNDTGTLDTSKDDQSKSEKSTEIVADAFESLNSFVDDTIYEAVSESHVEHVNNVNGVDESKMTSVTEDFLQNEKKFCQLDSFFPLLSDIRFTGPASEIMSTSFTQDSPTEPTSPEQDSKPTTTDILKEWDSDSDSHSTNSSSGEFIWKDGDGLETALVPSTRFEHQRDSGSQPSRTEDVPGEEGSSGSGDSGSGSEGDEVEFVPSSWDCRAAPSKSSLRSLEQAPDIKKRVVFKRQKYHCVYEYPREVSDLDVESPAYLPDFSTYSDWDATSAEEAEIGYGQLYGAPNPLDLFPLRSGIAFGADYDEDFFISSSARPFESLGVMSSSSQFFPGLLKAPPSPPPPALRLPLGPPAAPAPPTDLDFTTPDSGVEDVTPGSLPDEDERAAAWADSGGSSESVSPASPGTPASPGAPPELGGLRHTRDRLKLELPPSPHAPSPRHARVFSFVRTPLVMSDDTPPPPALQPAAPADAPAPEPTFSTFGKPAGRPPDAGRNIVLTDGEADEEGSPRRVERVKGEGTVLDSGDEDSGIESSSKATLERNTPNVS